MGRTTNYDVTREERRPLSPNEKEKFASHPEALKIVLLRPRIPQNTGSIARMCAATGCALEIVAPFFAIDDKKLKRAGLDYWPHLDVTVFPTLPAWLDARSASSKWLVEVNAPRHYSDVQFARCDSLVFGDEQDGIPDEWLQQWSDRHVDIPQKNVRSLNLATSVGIVTYEALRQLDWYSAKT